MARAGRQYNVTKVFLFKSMNHCVECWYKILSLNCSNSCALYYMLKCLFKAQKNLAIKKYLYLDLAKSLQIVDMDCALWYTYSVNHSMVNGGTRPLRPSSAHLISKTMYSPFSLFVSLICFPLSYSI